MMLYVFHVDVGRMMNFDMTVALSSVENLKDTIERLHGIPAANIVLLVSGGEVLTQSTQVSYYSAGTDTNPIYMFLSGEARPPPLVQPNEVEIELGEQVDRCMRLPPVYSTVETRAQLALRMYDQARDEERLCERLVHEQHLQQQGWSAVVANMEDLTAEFRQRFGDFCAAFDKHLEKRDKYLELLRNFSDDLTKLSRIPILPGLMPLAEEDFHGFDEFLNTDDVFSRSNNQHESVLMVGDGPVTAARGEDSGDNEVGTTSADDKSSTSPNKKLKMGNESADDSATAATSATGAGASNLQSSSTSSTRRRELNLLQWITSKENHNTLTLMSEECVQGLSTFNQGVYEQLKIDVQNIIRQAEQNDVKEIKGLSERLCRLDEFKHKIKGMVQDQKELSTAFQQNQNRAINLRDPSILPDLCASHQSQLKVMLQNHQRIRDHRRCIARAKDELGTNLHLRLRRIVWVENSMSEFDNRLLFYHRCLRRAERHIQIIEQIHQAPCIYVAAVTEVVRRKIFSGEFSLWASKLAEDFDVIHSEEIKRRQLFNANFEGHFLNILFPGMNDMPPAFANETPLVFDARLPNITKSDIDMLSSHLPDLAPEIQLPDMGPVINFFVSRSGAHQKERMEELLRQQVATVLGTAAVAAVGGVSGDKPLHSRLGELQKEGTGCDESETDTETEFEKVSAAVSAAHTTATVSTSTSENQIENVARSTTTSALLTQSAATLTDETELSTRAELQRVNDILAAMFKVSIECIRLSRVDLANFRIDAATYCEDLQSELQLLHEKWSVLRMQCEAREQKLLQENAQCEHELQLVRGTLQQRDSELKALQQQTCDASVLELKCLALEEELRELHDKVKTTQSEKESAVAAAREELIYEHKTEIESLRCRYKLMTSMERSPSDTSLEKIERPASSVDYNVIDRSEHEALLAQLRAAYEAEKEQAIMAAVENERAVWQSKVNMNSESVMANVGILKEMLADKERQLDQLREQDLMLNKENFQLKTRLDALTNEEGTSWLREKIEYLNRDKTRLEEELNVEKTRRLEMETSVAAMKGSTHEQGALALPRSKSSGSSHKYVALETCSKGDIVFVVWSVRHGQFMVVQDSPSLYFVHGDSLTALNLCLPSPPALTEGAAVAEELPVPMPFSAIGRVIDKEYCQARKDENRYRVCRGSKFYRIKLAPVITKQQTARRERIDAFCTSISRSVSQCESTHSEAPAGSAAAGGAVVAMTSTNIAATMLRQLHSMRGAMPGSTRAIQTPSDMDVTDSVHVATMTAPLAVASSCITADGAMTSLAVGTGNVGGIFKERTISITSVTEEDDEPLSERCRYISVSEEEEQTMAAIADAVVAAATAAAETITSTSVTAETQQPALQQSVITEQPTASSKLNLDLMLANADLMQQEQSESPSQSDVMKTTLTASTPSHALSAAIPIITGPYEELVDESCCSPPKPIAASFGTATTTSEDSDEYRSLEAKDDTDFTISE